MQCSARQTRGFFMKEVKNITLFVKNGKEVKRYLTHSYRRFYAKLRACSGQGYRVLIKYCHPEEYAYLPTNDSGWYTNKEKLLKTARAFLER